MYSLNTCPSLLLGFSSGLFLAYITRELFSRMLFFRKRGILYNRAFSGVEPACLLQSATNQSVSIRNFEDALLAILR